MNDNIKRLALLCGAWTQVYENKFGQKLMMIDSNFDYEKFAELIVNDCLNICEKLGDKGMDGHYCADEISRTFRSKQ